MNLIGKKVKNALCAYEVEKENMFVVHDDLEQNVGKYEVVTGTSFKGHNGLKSI